MTQIVSKHFSQCEILSSADGNLATLKQVKGLTAWLHDAMTWRQRCGSSTCCRLFHSLLEESLTVLLCCRGIWGGGSSSSSTNAGTGLTGMMGASRWGAVPEKSLLRCRSRMVRTKEQYLQGKVVYIVKHITYFSHQIQKYNKTNSMPPNATTY